MPETQSLVGKSCIDRSGDACESRHERGARRIVQVAYVLMCCRGTTRVWPSWNCRRSTKAIVISSANTTLAGRVPCAISQNMQSSLMAWRSLLCGTVRRCAVAELEGRAGPATLRIQGLPHGRAPGLADHASLGTRRGVFRWGEAHGCRQESSGLKALCSASYLCRYSCTAATTVAWLQVRGETLRWAPVSG